jgi:dTDP-4-dehydrorhamnose reductase
MAKMRILVTGSSGLLGLNLALQARERGEVIGTVYSHVLAKAPFKVIQADLKDERELSACIDEIKPDIIFNCAALANLEACESDPVSARELNVTLPERLAIISQRHSIKLVHFSTDAVFDGQRGNYSENDLPNPLSVYAKTKLEGEQAVLRSDAHALVVRVNFYGYSLVGKRSLAEFFLYNLAAGTRVFGFNDVFFCPLLVQHLGDILMEMVKNDLKGLFHVVSPQSLSKYEFGVSIARLFGLNEGLVESVSVNHGGLKAPRSQNLTLNVEKLKRSLDLPIPDQQSGLQKFRQLFEDGYPEKLRSYLAARDLDDVRGDE